MIISFTSSIVRRGSENYLNKEELITSLLSASSETTNQFGIQKIKNQQIELKSTSPSNTIDVLADLNVVDEDISFIHIQLYDKDSLNSQLNDLRFTLIMNDNILGDFSQFSLLNCKDFDSTIEISIPTIPASRKLALVMIIGIR